MSIRVPPPRGYVAPVGRTVRAQPTFIPRAPVAGGPGAALGPSAGGIAGIIGGLGVPLLCLGCLSTMALLGIFGTMIGAAAYMNGIQRQVRRFYEGGASAGSIVEMNIIVLFGALLFSFYVLFKHQFGLNRST